MSENEPTTTGRNTGPLTLPRIVAVVAAAGLLAGIIVGPLVSGRSTLAADPTATTPEHTIAVTGMADVSVAPDVADIVIGVTVQKSTVSAAQSAAASSMSAVIAAIKKDGVDDKDIVTVNLSLSPVYDYTSSAPKLVAQQFTNTVKVTVRNLKSVSAVIDDAIAAGATTVNGISFRLNDPGQAQAQARALAVADAKAKADALAAAAGVSIKGVASITETTIQNSPVPVALAMDAVGKAASTPVESGTTDIVVQVSITYLIG